jgi:hypothetical protein
VTKRVLQLVHLGTDGLDGHIQSLCGACEATFLGDDPEVIEMTIIEHAYPASVRQLAND